MPRLLLRAACLPFAERRSRGGARPRSGHRRDEPTVRRRAESAALPAATRVLAARRPRGWPPTRAGEELRQPPGAALAREGLTWSRAGLGQERGRRRKSLRRRG